MIDPSVARDYRSLIFIHIPKAAGTTALTVLRRQFPIPTRYGIDGNNVRSSVQSFIDLPQARRESIRFFNGHVQFGLHIYLEQPCYYLAFVRDPVDRIVSHYRYVLRTSHHYLHKELVSRKMTLEQYVCSGLSPELNNGQTRLIAAKEDDREIGADALFEIASRNIEKHFVFVGLAEYFDASIIHLGNLLGWRDLFYQSLNKSPQLKREKPLQKGTAELIRATNQGDQKLYEYAKQALFTQIEQTPNFSSRLRRFQAANRIYNFVHGDFLRKKTRNIFHRLAPASQR